VPILSVWVLRGHGEVKEGGFFDKARARYAKALHGVMRVRWLLVVAYLAVAGLLIWAIGTHIGTEIFPRVDVGQLQLRLRAATGWRRFPGCAICSLARRSIIRPWTWCSTANARV